MSKNFNFSDINKDKADLLVKLMKEKLSPEISNMIDNSNLNANHMIRFMYIGNLCREVRVEKGLSLREVSQKLKIPQYKITNIERSIIHNIPPDILIIYIHYLGLEEEFNKWLLNNRDVYEGLGK